MRDMLGNMKSLPSFFKQNSNFLLHEFEESCCLVVLVINENARSTNFPRVVSSHMLKLTLEQRLLNFILHMKHSNINTYNFLHWNWSRFVCV